MQVKVKITQVFDLKTGTSQSGKDWQMLNFVGETYGEYNKQIYFTCFNADVIETIKAGSDYDISFEIEAREYNEKYYNTVRVFKAELIGGNIDTETANDTSNPAGDGLPF